jgi:hypothetical protein
MRPRPTSLADVRVSDHAVLKWLERVHGIDVEFFRAEIRSIAGPAAAVGAAALRRDGFIYKFSGGAVVTVVPDERRR